MIIPRGVEHLPVAEDEVQVLLLEPKTTVNTGERGERTNRRRRMDLIRVPASARPRPRGQPPR